MIDEATYNFKELKAVLDEQYVILETPDGRYEEFNTRSEKYDDYEVITMQVVKSHGRLYVVVMPSDE